MNLRDFVSSWEGVRSENRLHRYVVSGLLVTNVLTGIAVLRTDRAVVLIPPALNGEVEMTRRTASTNLKESWGLYLAELMGNITPSNAEFIERTIGPLIAPGIYREVTDALSEQIQDLKADRISVSFRPHQVFYEKETDKVFVSGDHVSQGPNSHPDIRGRTYEFQILFKDYRPLLDHIEVYPGEPHTLEHQKFENKHATHPSAP